MLNTLVFFIISPFVGLLQAFKSYTEPWAKNSVWLFVAFYGFTMVKPMGMDSSVYVGRVQAMYSKNLTWNQFTDTFYDEDSESVDLYQPVVTYLVSRFTDNGNIFFLVLGLVYGFFYSRNIWLLLDACKSPKLTWPLWLLIITFASVIGFWNLNGVRMWTAAHIFFYGAMIYLVQGRKIGLVWLVASILVHYSFMPLVGLFLLFLAARLSTYYLYWGYLFSFTLVELNIEAVRSIIERYTPAFLLPRVSSYVKDEYIETIDVLNATANWYAEYYTKMLSWFILFSISYVYFKGTRFLTANTILTKLFLLSMILLSFGNLMSLLPSGGRYLVIANLFGMAFVFYYVLLGEDKNYLKSFVFTKYLLIVFLLVSLRLAFDTVSVLTIFGNPILAILFDAPIPLIDLIK